MIKPLITRLSFVLMGLALPVAWASAQVGAFRYLEIKVLDADKKPIAGATVDVAMSDTDFSITTNDKGIATLNFPQDAAFLKLKATAVKKVPLEVRWIQDRVPKEFTFAMFEGDPIGGIVQDTRGKPVAGVAVEGILISSHAAKNGEVRPVIGGELATTNNEGIWTASIAPPEEFEMRLKLTHEKFFSDVGFGKRRVASEDLRSLKHVEILEDRLPPQGTIVAPDGQPLKQAEVFVFAEGEVITLENGVIADRARKPNATTDDQGKYKFEPREDEFRVLCVNDKGWAVVPGRRYDKNQPVDFTLTPWARVEGVLREGDKVVKDEKLRLWVVENDQVAKTSGMIWQNEATTDAEGRFVFERLKNGYAALGKQAEYCSDIKDVKPQFSYESFVTLAPGITSNAEIRREGLSVSGTIVPIWYDGSEAGFQCGVVSFIKEDEPTDIVSKMFFEWGRSTTIGMNFDPVENAAALGALPMPTYVVPLEADGGFKLSNMPAGKYRIKLRLRGEETDEVKEGWLEGNQWEPLGVAEGKQKNAADLGVVEIEIYEAYGE